ncbi:MAG: D-glycero-beta-D-manno-heptose 1,7-bisphosphate 7-phosphatase [Pseudomonadota bacterium]
MKPIILDRDGVINLESKDFIKSPEEWQPLKGSLEAIARLTQAGYDVIIITNQSGIGRGLFSADMLTQIHVRMLDYVQQAGGKIHSILFCPHTPDAECECRKPKAGMYDELARRLGISYNGIYSVGDSIRDLLAAVTAGASPVLVSTGNGKKSSKQLSDYHELKDTPVFPTLEVFVETLLNEQNRDS